jgi:hypothetical protein
MVAAGFFVESVGLQPVLAVISGGFLAVAMTALVAPGFRALDAPRPAPV